MSEHIDKLIIADPYREPGRHWLYDRERREFDIVESRRPAGYVRASPNAKSFDDPGIFQEIPLVNQIRPRVGEWREKGYAGVSGTTKRLLEHWHGTKEDQRGRPFFFCQLEAIETLIWLTEGPANEKVGIKIPGDGGDFQRWCCKMATGSGKTVVMAMIIAWNFLNKVAYPADTRFSRHALVIAPGLTIKSRLQVLQPSDENNYYEAFDVVPSSMMDKLRQGKVLIHNWHTLAWDTQEQIDAKVERGSLRSVDKRKQVEVSDTVYIRDALGEMAQAHNIIVLNDEAHHAWRVNPEAVSKYKRVGHEKEEVEQATVWVGALDRIHRNTGILRCFDLSATPFYVSRKAIAEEALFPWIVSDFGLNDAIESGLVKTPRISVRDDSVPGKDWKSRLYHIYMDDEVKDALNRKRAKPSDPLPKLIHDAYQLLGTDWEETREFWERHEHQTPPVMITVVNQTESAARIKHAFDHHKMGGEALCTPEKILQIDSKVLKDAEERDVALETDDSSANGNGGKKLTQKGRAEYLRRTVDTIGKLGQPGEKIQNVISVNMLSEGWDAKTVTHIMGLRAFSSQLLCEQVVGRGLRRISYDDFDDENLLKPEYVNVFGVPFTFLPHEGRPEPAEPTAPKTEIRPVDEKLEHKIEFPNVLRIDYDYQQRLSLELKDLPVLELDTRDRITQVELQAVIDGKPNNRVSKEIGLQRVGEKTRVQTLVFQLAHAIYNMVKSPEWKCRDMLFIQLVRLLEKFIASDKLRFAPPGLNETERKIHLVLGQERIAEHIRSALQLRDVERKVLVFDEGQEVRSTAEVRPWYTGKPCEWSRKSHISHCVFDSRWESSAEYALDRSRQVRSFVKNDHLGFVIYYIYRGKQRKFYPDFIIHLSNGEYLVLEIKGQDDEQNRVKREYLEQWVEAVNEDGRFGKWHAEVAFDPADVKGILKQYAASRK